MELVQQAIEEPYIFEFLSLGEVAKERDVQRALIDHPRDFLLELSVGFAFVGTVELHRVNIERLKQFFRGRLVNEIDRRSVEEFKAWRTDQKHKNAKTKFSGSTVGT